MSKELIPVRLSHVLGQSGVGAIVRGPNGLAVVQDTRQWTDQSGDPAGKLIPYVERVRTALGISQDLREPPVARVLGNGQVEGVCVPATRFPSWMRCPSCWTLHRRPWKDAPAESVLHCHFESCKGKPILEQVPWVLAKLDGSLADVDWFFLAHLKGATPAQINCKVRNNLQLKELPGFENRKLRCTACGANNKFHGDERIPFGMKRMQPWTKDDFALPDEGSQNLAQVLAINDTRVYSPTVVPVLIIPPESRIRKGTVVDLLYRNSSERKKIDGARTPLARKAAIKTLATQYRCQPQDIEAALGELNRGYPLFGENLTPGQLLESEYKAFMEVLPDQRDDEDLVLRNRSEDWRSLECANDPQSESKNLVLCVEELVRVDRLKAVKVFRGFSRLGGEKIVPPDIVGESNWLPAIELYGEGIFITLNEERLRIWEEQPWVLSRLMKLQSRFVQSGQKEPSSLTPRFMLLHTLSHLLIRQIESEGGYPAASLIERIYCAQGPESMAGILIHVAVPDISGSLGGLAELAEPKRFLGILSHALEHAHWCSLDPVCSEHDGQGPGLLNRAACHACTLVPEPACAYGNTLLDRSFIKGDDLQQLRSFFGAA